MTANSEFSKALLSSSEKSNIAASIYFTRDIICKMTFLLTCHVGLRPADAGVLTRIWATHGWCSNVNKSSAASVGTILSMAWLQPPHVFHSPGQNAAVR